MSGKNLFFLFSVWALVACAKPNYQDVPDLKTAQKAGLNCSRNTNLCDRLTWENIPTESTMGSFQLEFFEGGLETPAADLSGEPIVVLWMPSMGHGSSPVQVDKISPGVYRASRVFFVMPGAWEIRVQIKNGNTVVDEIIQNITI